MRKYSIDAKLDFGEVTQTGCENILNLGATSAERMVVRAVCTETATGATGLTLKVQGSANGTSNWVDVAALPAVVAVANVTADAEFNIPLPEGYNKQYLKVVASGPTTVKLDAWLDVYTGI